MVDRNKVGEICTKQRLQPKNDGLGAYWVLPDFKDMLMIALDNNGNWEDGTPMQQRKFEQEIGMRFDNRSAPELDRYLTAPIEMLRSGQKPPEQSWSFAGGCR
jgi:hypothetical protein